MIRRVYFYSKCFAFILSVFLILTGSQYAVNIYYPTSIESRGHSSGLSKIEDGDNLYIQQISTNSYIGSQDIETIIENTRSKIKFEVSKYNITQSGGHIKDLIIESGGRPLQTLIISTWRSGSTFLGDLVNAIPGTFYHYEPLLSHGIVKIRGLPESKHALATIKDMFKCNYEYMEDYFDFGKNNLFQFNLNTRLWDHCKYNKDLCYDADFVSRFCKLFPIQSIKLVRLRLGLVQEILDDKEFNVRVILLVRDPRGVMQSRRHRGFCKTSPDCWQPSHLCADMVSDYVAAGRLLKQYPNRLLVLRFEELALKPYMTAHQILKFLRLSARQSINEFLRSHTNTEVAGVTSTFRVTRDVPFKWKKVLDFNSVDEIQIACKEAMMLWGYQLAHNATHMSSAKFNPVGNYTISQ